jgi:phospholipid-translocating ATPase
MTVVVKTPDGEIKALMKGADSIVRERLTDPDSSMFKQTLMYLNSFADSGLRTLLLAERVLDKHEYEEWNGRY